MKSPFGKLKKIGLNKGDHKETLDHPIPLHIDALTQAAKDMRDMRTCYDSLLSAAAATANSAYEFSESLLEMGNCLLEKTIMHDDGESGGTLSMLGRVQLELQKLVDSYRSQIVMTITNPSESLLSELRKVEEMKLQCDEKRETFEYMSEQFREKGKSKHGKGESFTSQKLQVVREEYDEVARLCIFRVESLKQGQSRSLLTQAARHHAAQLNFFRKGLQSLEAVEPHIKNVAEKQHIDYDLCEPNEGQEGDEGNSFKSNDDGELSFDYRQNKLEPDNTYAMRNSMEMDPQILSQQRRAGSHSAPIFAEKFDPADRNREVRSAVPKLNTHVLPTPADAKSSMASSSTPLANTAVPVGSSKNLWHSSPLDIGKQKKLMDDHLLSARSSSKSQTVLEESNNDKHLFPLPRPLTEGAPLPQYDTHSGFESKKIKRQAFSGPLVSKSLSSKQLLPTSGPISSSEPPQAVSGLLSHASGPPQAPSVLNVPHSVSPPPVSSPKISELHELPRPPESFSAKPVRATLGHSAPLVNRIQEVSPTKRNNVLRQSKEGSPLPLPQLTVSRSFSIPSRSQREMVSHSSEKLLEPSQAVQNNTEVASPPLTPLTLSNMKSPISGQIRVVAGSS
ncbi:uncharacterized protein At2g33490-like isoform X4 [Andrographis paniculata]|uniref:uncharacterized protein At2g33490-like isoform X4 n=1 Tax=Andrographis paniculata TaxID=175694 RepID=UPI0021E72439|nr:uncharacterized protein At2g33490-like isoform X4 [Andrographis paniculata]